MGGIELTEQGLFIDREPNELDTLAIEFSTLLDRLDIDHVFVAGYVAILAGRSRSTEDIDVILERCAEETISELASVLSREGFWGASMPLDSLFDVLDSSSHAWVARDGDMNPRLDLLFPTDEYDRASLRGSIPAHIDDATVPIGPIELQIAYKLSLEGRTDHEDAAHLYVYFSETLSTERLEHWVNELDVHNRYAQLKRW